MHTSSRICILIYKISKFANILLKTSPEYTWAVINENFML